MSSNKIKIGLYIIIFVFPFIFSCDRNENPENKISVEYFAGQVNIGVYLDGNNIFAYNESEYQIALNRMRKVLRLQTDGQEHYVNMLFSVFPLPGEGMRVNIDMNYKTLKDQRIISLVPVIIKKRDGKYWLWDEDMKIGIILPENM